MLVDEQSGAEETRRLRGMRRIIAAQMMRSHAEIPGVHIVDEVDVTGLPLSSLLPTVVHRVARMVLGHKSLNAHFDGRDLTTYSSSHVGIAVDTQAGLMVPVVTDAHEKSVAEISEEIHELAAGARSGTLSPTQMRGATISVTSPGRRGGLMATPLINPPQTAIVGVHRAQEQVVVREGRPAVRTMANLTVTFDHRVIDGAESGDFLLSLIDAIEHDASNASMTD